MKNKKIFAAFLATVLSIGSINVLPEKVNAAETNEWNFEYTGSVEEFTVPYTGKYFIEIYGASGGAKTFSSVTGGRGGLTSGYINLLQGEKFYISIGEAGKIGGSRTWNGGGASYNNSGSGGGATSITTELIGDGQLVNYEENKEKILMVAGGGAGQGKDNNTIYGGSGGGTGISGYDQDMDYDLNSTGLNEGSCTYKFGIGQSSNEASRRFDCSHQSNHGGGAGGGGYTGGTAGACDSSSGGGGSGYCSDKIYQKTLSSSDNFGNGKAQISYCGEVYSNLIIDLNGHGTYDGQREIITISNKYGTEISIDEPIADDGYLFHHWSVVSGDAENVKDKFTFGWNDVHIKAVYSSDLVIENVTIDNNAFNNKGGVSIDYSEKDELDKKYIILQSENGTNYYNVFQNTDMSNETEYKWHFGTVTKAQEFNTPVIGIYKLEAFGSGHSAYSVKGGYSYGYKYLSENQKLYIATGNYYLVDIYGTPLSSNTNQYGGKGGWNGGGRGGWEYYSMLGRYDSAYGGAGATHIATKLIGDGQLFNYVNDKESVLLCAGGAGGPHYLMHSTAYGGGRQGGTPTDTTGRKLSPATETSGYAFGRGQDGIERITDGVYDPNPGGGGGGGWFGGYSWHGWPKGDWSGMSGGGGSGHVGDVINGNTVENYHNGSGEVDITLTQELLSGTNATNIYAPDKKSPNMPSDGVLNAKNENILISWKNNGDNGSTYFHKVESYLFDEIVGLGEKIQESLPAKSEIISGIKGYYYYIDKNSTGTVTEENSFTDTASVEIPVVTGDRYFHVAAVDNAGNISGTYTMKIPSIAKYTVKHYAQNEDGTYSLVETEELTGTIGTTVTPEVHLQTGRDNPEKKSVVITADGKAVVEYYYDVARYDISGTVQWNDHENEYGTRPSDVDVTIYREGAEAGIVTVPASATSNRYSFKNMQKYNLTTGALLNYTVSQSTAYSQAALVTTEDKYTTTNSGFDFLNTIKNTDLDKPENPSEEDKGFFLDGNIIWEDNENSLGFRPDTVSIQLWQKGETGEFIKYREPVVVDADTENYYSFDWLPKYWYDENDIPTAYEYKTEEIFSAWYVQNGEMKDAYTINADMPDKFDFTNVLNIPDIPIIPVNQYENTLIVKTNTEEKVRIILKPLELNIDNSFNVSYGNKTEEDTEVLTNKEGNTVTSLPSTRYEVFVDSKEYDISDMELSLAENMELEEIDGKWYLTIHNQPEDSIGTLTINLTKKEVYYQDCCRISNIYAHISEAAVETMLTNEISTFSLMAADAVTVEYINTDIEVQTYSIGDEVEISDYVGRVPENIEFAGWAASENGEAKYMSGDTIIIENSLILYPIFEYSEKSINAEKTKNYNEEILTETEENPVIIEIN